MRIIFFDTETTGNAEDDRLLQLAMKERAGEEIVNAIYKPPLPSSIGAMAVHHITERMTDGKPAFQDSAEYDLLKELFEHEETVSVAHNAAFDIGMLSREGIRPKRHICTYKVVRAMDMDESLEQYKLQYLRYFFGIEVDAEAYDAMGDVLVLEAVFEELLHRLSEHARSEEAALEEMLRISERPVLFSTLRFGKYRDKRIADVARSDPGYLEWLLGEKRKDAEGEADWIFTLEHYLGYRR